MPVHVPVMAAEVVEALRPARGGLFVDCTVGAGGHARALLAAGATRLVGIDRDGEAIDRAREALAEWGDRVALVHGDYRDLARLLDERGVTTVDGAVADLGVSSLQLDGAGRGFSFRRDEALDMRMDTSRGPTAADLVASAGEQVLSDVIFRFGEERRSRAIAHAIVEARRTAPVDTTARLAAIVRRVVGRSGRIDPATRTFQAIRIWVNGELDGLDAFVRAACGRLGAGARLGVITFHSLEDRPVKHTLRALAGESGPLRLVTKKAVVPGAEERRANPRARSARLRVIERME